MPEGRKVGTSLRNPVGRFEGIFEGKTVGTSVGGPGREILGFPVGKLGGKAVENSDGKPG